MRKWLPLLFCFLTGHVFVGAQTIVINAGRLLDVRSGWLLANQKILVRDGHLGAIEVGKFANIIAVSGDPLADITELERVNS